MDKEISSLDFIAYQNDPISNIKNELISLPNKFNNSSKESLIKLIDLCLFNNESNTIKLKKILNLITGFFNYIHQFGIDNLLIEFTIKFNKEFLYNKDYNSDIETLILYFAMQDSVISQDLLNTIGKIFDYNSWTMDFQNDNKIYQQTHFTTMPKCDNQGKFIKSLSEKGGFITTNLDKYTEDFVKYAVFYKKDILNIGSGLAIPERIAILLGAEEIICNDISTEQLAIIKNVLPIQYQKKLILLSGSFPEKINLANYSLNLIGIFRVLHFFDPINLIISIKKFYKLLKPNGKLIITAETPYLGNWKKFIPEFERRIKEKQDFPGFITDTSIYETNGYSTSLPQKMHFLDVNTISRILIENGFRIIECKMFSREIIFPKEILFDGRESIGVIAEKI